MSNLELPNNKLVVDDFDDFDDEIMNEALDEYEKQEYFAKAEKEHARVDSIHPISPTHIVQSKKANANVAKNNSRKYINLISNSANLESIIYGQTSDDVKDEKTYVSASNFKNPCDFKRKPKIAEYQDSKRRELRKHRGVSDNIAFNTIRLGKLNNFKPGKDAWSVEGIFRPVVLDDGLEPRTSQWILSIIAKSSIPKKSNLFYVCGSADPKTNAWSPFFGGTEKEVIYYIFCGSKHEFDLLPYFKYRLNCQTEETSTFKVINKRQHLMLSNPHITPEQARARIPHYVIFKITGHNEMMSNSYTHPDLTYMSPMPFTKITWWWILWYMRTSKNYRDKLKNHAELPSDLPYDPSSDRVAVASALHRLFNKYILQNFDLKSTEFDFIVRSEEVMYYFFFYEINYLLNYWLVHSHYIKQFNPITILIYYNCLHPKGCRYLKDAFFPFLFFQTSNNRYLKQQGIGVHYDQNLIPKNAFSAQMVFNYINRSEIQTTRQLFQSLPKYNRVNAPIFQPDIARQVLDIATVFNTFKFDKSSFTMECLNAFFYVHECIKKENQSSTCTGKHNLIDKLEGDADQKGFMGADITKYTDQIIEATQNIGLIEENMNLLSNHYHHCYVTMICQSIYDITSNPKKTVYPLTYKNKLISDVYRTNLSQNPSLEQIEAIKKIRTQRFSVVVGNPGSGKTKTLRWSCESFHPYKTIFTSRNQSTAQDVGRRRVCLKASTIHRLLIVHSKLCMYCNNQDRRSKIIAKSMEKAKYQRPQWFIDFQNQYGANPSLCDDPERVRQYLIECAKLDKRFYYAPLDIAYNYCPFEIFEADDAIIVLDEYSLVSVRLFGTFIFSLNRCCRSNFTIGIAGDGKQMPSIAPGDLHKDISSACGRPLKTILTRNYRSGANSNISKSIAACIKGPPEHGPGKYIYSNIEFTGKPCIFEDYFEELRREPAKKMSSHDIGEYYSKFYKISYTQDAKLSNGMIELKDGNVCRVTLGDIRVNTGDYFLNIYQKMRCAIGFLLNVHPAFSKWKTLGATKDVQLIVHTHKQRAMVSQIIEDLVYKPRFLNNKYFRGVGKFDDISSIEMFGELSKLLMTQRRTENFHFNQKKYAYKVDKSIVSAYIWSGGTFYYKSNFYGDFNGRDLGLCNNKVYIAEVQLCYQDEMILKSVRQEIKKALKNTTNTTKGAIISSMVYVQNCTFIETLPHSGITYYKESVNSMPSQIYTKNRKAYQLIRRIKLIPVTAIGKNNIVKPTHEHECRYLPCDNNLVANIESADAMTITASQGGEFKNVICLFPKKTEYIKRHAFIVAISRAKAHLTVVGDDYDIQEIIKNVEKKRKTYLGKYIKKEIGTHLESIPVVDITQEALELGYTKEEVEKYMQSSKIFYEEGEESAAASSDAVEEESSVQKVSTNIFVRPPRRRKRRGVKSVAKRDTSDDDDQDGYDNKKEMKMKIKEQQEQESRAFKNAFTNGERNGTKKNSSSIFAELAKLEKMQKRITPKKENHTNGSSKSLQALNNLKNLEKSRIEKRKRKRKEEKVDLNRKKKHKNGKNKPITHALQHLRNLENSIRKTHSK